MIVRKTEDGCVPLFKPFTISITIESREEAKALYAIFNHKTNSRLLPPGSAIEIRESIGEVGYLYQENDKGNGYINGVNGDTYYRS